MGQTKHFVLVHGACHGGWSWYKLKPLLESAGHRVTVVDLTASGINMKAAIEDVYTAEEYSKPLLEIIASLASNEKAILVGHSLGGLNLAIAMEKYPQKIENAVFLSAFLPDTVHKPSYVLDQYVERTPSEAWLDTKFSSYGNPTEPSTSMLFGPKFLSSKLYQASPIEDLELAKTLIRPSSLFREDLSKAKKFSDERYGSITRVFIICDEDQAITVDYAKWMIENSGTKNVLTIEGVDHMPMFSNPHQLCNCLVEIALKYT